jgi:integrase
MPKKIAPLTNVEVKNAQPKEKPSKLFDGNGLYLLVMPTGAKYWRMKVTIDGKELSPLAFGVYPEVSLADARAKREEARRLLAEGVNPHEAKRQSKLNRRVAAENNFEAVARRWHTEKLSEWKESTASATIRRLEIDVFPYIGKLPIKDIKTPAVLAVLRKIQERPAVEIARRLGQVCSQIFRFAILEGHIESDPVYAIRGNLKKSVRGHHAAIGVDELPEFLRKLSSTEYRMYAETRICMRLMMLTFVRTSELIETPWSEIDLEKEEWVIPWQRMKMGKRKINPIMENHHVNLPTQGWTLLRELHLLTGRGKFLFPNKRDHERHASNGIILAALKDMGYAGKHTGHGFRSLAMGVIKEKLGYRHDVVDRQLAHQSTDKYGEAYDRARFLAERRIMMQEYANYLDAISSGNILTPKFTKVA